MLEMYDLDFFRDFLDKMEIDAANLCLVVSEDNGSCIFHCKNTKAGVYAIVIDKNLYIGSTSISKGVSERLNQHRWALHGNRHKNTHMQNAYKKHKKFLGFCLFNCDERDVLAYEQTIIDTLNPNLNICLECCSSAKGVKRSDDVKKRMSESQKGRVFTEEHIKNMSDSHKGYIMPESQKKKISQALMGKKMSEENLKRISKEVSMYSLDGTFIKKFKSTSEAARELNGHANPIQSCALGKDKHITAYGYVWRYGDDPFDKFETKLIPYSDRHWKTSSIYLEKEDGDKIFFNSIKSACQYLKVDKSTIRRAKINNRTVKGYKVVYVESL